MKRCRVRAICQPPVLKNIGVRLDGSKKQYKKRDKKLNVEAAPKRVSTSVGDGANDGLQRSCVHFIDYDSCNVCSQLIDPEEDLWLAVKNFKKLRKLFGNCTYVLEQPPEEMSTQVFMRVDLSGSEI